MLIVLSGLPGVGKTTIAKALLAQIQAVYVRVDAIEHALRQCMGDDADIGAAGYMVGVAITASNLKVGNSVIADCVNPVPESREAWRNVARDIAGTPLIELEIRCGDENEHRRRVEERLPDIAGFQLPTWSSVKSHRYVAWTEPHMALDTAVLSVGQAVALVMRQIALSLDDHGCAR